MNTKLIADAGSTKVHWVLLAPDGMVAHSVHTEGINALLADSESIKNIIRLVANDIPSDIVPDEIYYYGAGCATPEICRKISDILISIWPGTIPYVDSDLVAAARSLFSNRKGIACILGTGSNSCLFDGEKIIQQIPSLGFILGDEGSGAALGKRLVSDAFKNQLPDNIREKFLDSYRLTLPEILDRIYKRPSPNKFLASLVPFLKENIWNPYIYSLILEELTQFVKRNVAMYHRAHSLELSFTGSIAFHFDKILREAASSQGFRISSITESPMQGLIKHHSRFIEKT